MRTFVPAYFGPWDTQQWEALLALSPDSVVINPASGPGSKPVNGYRPLVKRMHAAGTEVLGYVDTNWLQRPMPRIDQEIERYQRWYGVKRTFFDRIPSQPQRGRVAKLRELLACAYEPESAVLNAGVPIPSQWYRSIPRVRWCTFEGPPTLLKSNECGGPGARQIYLVHSVSARQRAAVRAAVDERGIGAGCLTTDTMPNPWDVCPESLRTVSRGRAPLA